MKITLKEIEEFFGKKKLSKYDHTRLNEWTMIFSCEKFVESHISILKANSGDVKYMPYFDRLKELYLKVNAEN